MQNNIIAIGLSTILVILGMVLFFLIQRQKSQTEIRKALIERFGAAQDLGAFLQSEGGQKFLTGLSTGMSSPLGSVLGSVQKGIIILFLGFGCRLGSPVIAEWVDAVGAILICVGLGYLASAVVTRRLSKKWGLIEKPGDFRPKDLGK